MRSTSRISEMHENSKGHILKYKKKNWQHHVADRQYNNLHTGPQFLLRQPTVKMTDMQSVALQSAASYNGNAPGRRKARFSTCLSTLYTQTFLLFISVSPLKQITLPNRLRPPTHGLTLCSGHHIVLGKKSTAMLAVCKHHYYRFIQTVHLISCHFSSS